MNIKDILDAASEARRGSRSRYHLTLGELIEELESIENREIPVRFDFGGSPTSPHSYRGYYSDLGFEVMHDDVSVSEFLQSARNALGEEFTGYKGGDFLMDEETPLWQSEWGSSPGYPILDIETKDYEVVLITGDKDTF